MENWGKISLEDVCLIKKGQQLNKLDLESAGDYPCINGGISPSGYTEKWNTKANTITISEGGNSCGFVNMLRTDFWSGGHCYSLLYMKDKVDNEFLYYALKGRESLIMDLRVGSGLPNIQQKAIKKFEFIYPKDKTEQTTIASILSKTDQAIAHTEALIVKYTRIKTGLMQDLLTKGIDENGKIRTEQTHEVKDSPLGRIPKEWECVKFGSFIREIQAGKSLQCPNIPAGSNQYGIIKVSAMSQFGFRPLENKVLTNEILVNKNYIISKDDLLISRANTTDLVGIVCIVEDEYSNLLLSDKSLRLVINEENLRKRLALYILSQPYVRIQIELNATGSSASMKNISQKSIENLEIKKPISVTEQDSIIKIILRLNHQVLQLVKEVNKLHSIKTGLMQDLLSGKVRVNNLMKEKK